MVVEILETWATSWCNEYQLNKLTVVDPEPMPTAEHLFQKLSGDKFFTKIDLSKLRAIGT